MLSVPSSGGSSGSGLSSTSRTPLLRALPAPPFRPGFDKLYPDSTKQLNRTIETHVARFALNRATGSARRGPSSVLATDDGGGQAGTSVSSYAYGSIAANQTVYGDYYPRSGDILYAPTMKGPGRACIEITTVYGYGPPSVGFWDFCIPGNSNFHNSKPVDATFINTYVRDLGDGVPMYSALVTIDPRNPNGWEGALYNYAANYWEVIYSDSGDGSFNGGEGWSMFETHYHSVGSECGQVPNIQSDSIRLDGNNVDPSTSYSFHYGQCFGQDIYGNPTSAYGPYPYLFTNISPNYHWQVVSQQPPPTPTPRPTPPDGGGGGQCGRFGCIQGP